MQLHVFPGPGPGNLAYWEKHVWLMAHPDVQLATISEHLGSQTNNFAEYTGLIQGLQAALACGVKHIQVKGDSKLVVMQVALPLAHDLDPKALTCHLLCHDYHSDMTALTIYGMAYRHDSYRSSIPEDILACR